MRRSNLPDVPGLSPSSFHFSVGFLYLNHVFGQMVLKLIRTNEIEKKKPMLIHTNHPLITSSHIERYLFFSDGSVLIRNFLRNGRLSGLTNRACEA